MQITEYRDVPAWMPCRGVACTVVRLPSMAPLEYSGLHQRVESLLTAQCSLDAILHFSMDTPDINVI